MMPSPTSPDKNANIPRPITTIPADLKKRGACFPCANDAGPNDNNVSIGKVPRANVNIIKAPDINDPLPTATICID